MENVPNSRGLQAPPRADPRFLCLTMALCLAIAILLVACSGGSSSSISSSAPADPPGTPVPLTSGDVTSVMNAAAMSINLPLTVAVVDRLGNVLAVSDTPNHPVQGIGNFGQLEDAHELAVALARSAAYFSNSHAPLSSRTVRYISGIHFPPGVANATNAALYGIENTNRGCLLDSRLVPGAQVARGTLIDGSTLGLGIITGKATYDDNAPFAVNPGGVPVFKLDSTQVTHALVGGVGVVTDPQADPSGAAAEYAAFVGAQAGGPSGLSALPSNPLPPPGEVLIDGVALPFVNQTTMPAGLSAGTASPSTVVFNCAANPAMTCGTVPPDAMYLLGPNSSSNPSGLAQSEVQNIVQNAIATASITRAQIRLPLNSHTAMTIAVADIDGTLLALYRMTDGTIFSTDVAVSKARNVTYFSTNASSAASDLPGVPSGTAVTNRTIGFGAQPLFPPGINGSAPGPFYQLYLNDIVNPCTQGSQIVPGANPHANQSGIVFFPGSETLYKNGVIVGGLGVSGDGVDQDDFVTHGGAFGAPAGAPNPGAAVNFEPNPAIRADQISIQGVRLPYLKFPRNPTEKEARR